MSHSGSSKLGFSGFYDPDYCCGGSSGDGASKATMPYRGPSGHELCAPLPCAPDCLDHCTPSTLPSPASYNYPNDVNSPQFRKMYGYHNNPHHPAMTRVRAYRASHTTSGEWWCDVVKLALVIAVLYVLYRMNSKK